jgi:hypothetical protein
MIKRDLTVVASQNGCALQCPEILAEQQTTFFLLCFPAVLTIQDDSQTAEVILFLMCPNFLTVNSVTGIVFLCFLATFMAN